MEIVVGTFEQLLLGYKLKEKNGVSTELQFHELYTIINMWIFAIHLLSFTHVTLGKTNAIS